MTIKKYSSFPKIYQNVVLPVQNVGVGGGGWGGGVFLA